MGERMTESIYTITHDGGRWIDCPYEVREQYGTYGDGSPMERYVTDAMTKWGARLAVRRHRRKQARGSHLVWRG